MTKKFAFNNTLSQYVEVSGGRGANRFLFQTTMPCHNLDMMHINFTLYTGAREKIKASVIIYPKELITFWQEAQACQGCAYLIYLVMIYPPQCQHLSENPRHIGHSGFHFNEHLVRLCLENISIRSEL